MLEAFTYMFKDNMLRKKALMYFIFVLLANLLTQISLLFAPVAKSAVAPPQYYILSLLSTVVMFIPIGYLISCVKAIIEQKENTVLPFLNLKNNFVLGFKFFISITLLSLVFIVILVMLSILAAILYPVITKTMFYAILTILFVIPFLFIVFYSPAFCCLLAKKEWFTTFFRFVRVTKLVASDIVNYLKRFGLMVLLILAGAVIGSIINILCPSNYFGATLMALIMSAISSYTVFVFAHLTAKSIKADCIE